MDTQNPTGLPQVINELVSGSVTRTYAYSLQRISQNQLISGVWTPSFYGYDAHGNVRYLTNAASTVTDTYEYDAFGNLLRSTGTTPNNYRFSSEPFDPALGMYQMRARWYRQATGRFASRDPIEGLRCCGLSWNPYIYVRDNPVNAIDPTGRAMGELFLFEYSLRMEKKLLAITGVQYGYSIAVAKLYYDLGRLIQYPGDPFPVIALGIDVASAVAVWAAAAFFEAETL